MKPDILLFSCSVLLAMLLSPAVLAADAGRCGDPAILISSVQGIAGRDDASPLEGHEVTVEAVVYQDLQGDSSDHRYRGFLVQEEDQDADDRDDTSEGLFVFDTRHAVRVGDRVRVRGMVSEFHGLTELKKIRSLEVCASNQPLPSAAPLRLPLDSMNRFEQYEGMRVKIDQFMRVSDFYVNGYSFARYGSFLASTRMFMHPNDLDMPSADRYQQAKKIKRLSSIVVDDGHRTVEPETIPYPHESGFDNSHYLRLGYRVEGLQGAVMQFDSADHSMPFPYFMVPSVPPVFSADGQDRTVAPVRGEHSDLVVASFNLENYFNGLKPAGQPYFPARNDNISDYRGAHSKEDFLMQQAKLVSALLAMDADLIGVQELENDGYQEDSALVSLVSALNQKLAPDKRYTYVRPDRGRLGRDAITVAMLYRPAVLKPEGLPRVLDAQSSVKDERGEVLFSERSNRPVLVQTFVHPLSGRSLTAAVLHLKSKGGNCPGAGDEDVHDGAGACNAVRSRAMKALTAFLRPEQNRDVLILGDFNAYSKEQPLLILEKNGYLNLQTLNVSRTHPAQAFSYSHSGFLGSLDHMFASPDLARRLTVVNNWHINSVESSLFDYDSVLDGHLSNDHYAAPDPYRSSDHDPLIAGFQMNKAVADEGKTDVVSEQAGLEQPVASGKFWWLFFFLGIGLPGLLFLRR